MYKGLVHFGTPIIIVEEQHRTTTHYAHESQGQGSHKVWGKLVSDVPILGLCWIIGRLDAGFI